MFEGDQVQEVGPAQLSRQRCEAVPAALGVFYVFKDEALR
jgi:hypothetical protein